MIASAVLNFLGGGMLKAIVTFIAAGQQNKHDHMMATSNVELARLEAMYGGEDKLTDKMSRRVRNMLALIIVGTYSLLVGWIVIKNPEVAFAIQVDATPGIFCGWFGSTTDKTTMVVSGGSILWSYIELASMATGYYFVKFGKSR